MFTGLIQAVGKVSLIEHGETSAKLAILSPEIASQIAQGDSVSVNGVCLTVTGFDKSKFSVDVMVQTLNLTSTGLLKEGSPVNLELATRTSDRLGGHIVQGHVDGVAEVVAISTDSQWTRMDISIPSDLMKYVVAQGSICVEGVSLTVGELNDAANQISVWLIPETLANTNLSIKQPGDALNIEVDVLAKYVERLIARGQGNK
ncbi:RibC Riboflavin synthase alpha chain [Candidatus Nanopelagicaceae bacterium]